MYALNEDPEVIQYTGDSAFESLEAAQQFLQNYDAYAQSGMGRWAVVTKNNAEFIGWCGLKQHQEYVDIGFRFFRKEWGKGYATESAKACLEYAFTELGLSEVVGRAATANVASVRVLEKLGMTYWKAAPCDGIMDAVYYRISS